MNAMNSFPPLSHHGRHLLAKQLRTARYYDHHSLYATNRPFSEYVWRSNGLAHFVTYVEQLPGGRLLDCGGGNTRAAYEAAKLYPELDIEATTVAMPSKWDRKNTLLATNPKRVHITSAERLRGIDPGVGGIIGVVSATYSTLPEKTVNAADSILLPGGAVKFVCINHAPRVKPQELLHRYVGAAAVALITGGARQYMDDLIHTPRIHQVTTAETFAELFQQKGYDVYTAPAPFDEHHSIFLGIKPGGSTDTTAQALYELDSSTLPEQMAAFPDSER